jgi:antirestriction protein
MNKIKERMNKKSTMKKIAAGASVFDVWVRRLDNDKEMELSLPTDNLEDELAKGLGEDYWNQDVIIVDVDSDIHNGVDQYSVGTLNDLAEEIATLDDSEIEVVAALVNDGGYDIEDAIEKAPECYVTNAKTDEDLGYYYVEDVYGGPSELGKDTLERYFDYESFGRDIRLEGNFIETDNGYIEVPY